MPPAASPSPSPAPSSTFSTTPTLLHASSSSPPSKLPIDFSPPLIAMVVVVATAFLIVTYSRLLSRHVIPPLIRFSRHWRRRRRRSYLPSSIGDLDSPPYDSSSFDAFHVFSPYGLDESVIKTIPLSLYTAKTGLRSKDCAVCLIEFEDDEYVRTLPVCSHAFHVDCIDMWLRSHANCPLCRAGIFRPESPFIPLMAARIRPSLDDALLRTMALEPLAETPPRESVTAEITPCAEEQSPRRTFSYWEDRLNGGDFVLKRSHSFGFERSSASERMMVTEPTTASPWRYRRGGSFWSKRPSPFGSLTKPRVFSFRSHRGMNMKSPFFRRKGFFPLSESSARFSTGGGSSRRTKSMTSPMFMRSSALTAAAFSSSRLRCGDPEALLSPERFNRR
ncbi:PREDICTED: RING-H2 finger protein ATL65 [Fragaria vesca subsp. vesca]|uniref:RING-H2 finger protein ATL65 n=1 Tax=Fragaria vesca subsp. vesca TaxID=101020 RepID=UPI0002C30107|nr:PREDICTED: RING-H2 finger protein ATL65 [Fragaria vesca subsp. vesca]